MRGVDLEPHTSQDDRPEGETEGGRAFWDGRLSPLRVFESVSHHIPPVCLPTCLPSVTEHPCLPARPPARPPVLVLTCVSRGRDVSSEGRALRRSQLLFKQRPSGGTAGGGLGGGGGDKAGGSFRPVRDPCSVSHTEDVSDMQKKQQQQQQS